MREAVIVSTARTGLAKSWRGAFNMTHGATMGGHVVRHALERAHLDPAEVDDVVIGCAFPEGATGSNIARQIALRAGCPVTVPGMTVNRFCSSGLQTIAIAAQRIMSGEGSAFVAGGVESISCVQNEANKHMLREPWLRERKPAIYWPMLGPPNTLRSATASRASDRTNMVPAASSAPPRPPRQAGSPTRSCR
jgi:acetyl-CoA C-acetyltransferase